MKPAQLEQILGYEFKSVELLNEALTHPSVTCEKEKNTRDNQRLEFLGDAVVQLIITDELFTKYSNYGEGKLTKMRARVVSKGGLSSLARNIRLGGFLRFSTGEKKAGGEDRNSNLCDAFEAVIGAVYLDGGFLAAEEVLLRIVGDTIDHIAQSPDEENPKGRLQEILQADSNESPEYTVLSESGPAHQKTYVVAVLWQGKELGAGEGGSKKKAEMKAAQQALTSLLKK